MRGGYKILDFKSINLTLNRPTKIKGIYEAIESNYYKPLLLEGLVISNIERVNRFVVFGSYQGKYRSILAINGNVDLLTCTIDNEDNVTLTEQ